MQEKKSILVGGNVFKKYLGRRWIFFAVVMAALMTTISSDASSSAMRKNKKLTTLQYEIEINAPKQEVWNLLSDFDNFDWTPSVVDAHLIGEPHKGIGTVRHCDLPKNDYIVERVVEWIEGKSFTYVIEDAKAPIHPDSYATWEFSGDDTKTIVNFEVHYRLKYGILGKIMNVVVAKRKFTKSIKGFMGDLKSHMESVS